MKNKIRYSWEDLRGDCNKIAREVLDSDDFVSIKNIYGIQRGGLIPAVVLSHILNIPIITDVNEISQTTLVIDDISDSGETLIKLSEKFNFKLLTATLCIDLKTKFKPDFFAKTKKSNEWFVFPWELLLANTKKDN